MWFRNTVRMSPNRYILFFVVFYKNRILAFQFGKAKYTNKFLIRKKFQPDFNALSGLLTAITANHQFFPIYWILNDSYLTFVKKREPKARVGHD